MSVSSVIKSIQDIMRKDAGVDGDAQRLSQMSWLLFLKIFDAQEEELEFEQTTTANRSPINIYGVAGQLITKALQVRNY